MNVLNFDFHEWIQYSSEKLGTVPLALVSGLQLRFSRQHWRFWDWTSI
jgi:hypothetical protein